MLGHLRRTTRLDIGLGLAFAGFAYLAWCLVVGTARVVLAPIVEVSGPVIPKEIFVRHAFLLDVVALVWMAITLALLVRSSRQTISVSWAWVSMLCQTIVAAVGGIAVARFAADMLPGATAASGPAPQAASVGLSLPIMMAVGTAIWATFLVWMLIERARLDRLGPTLRDGLRTNVYR